MAHSGHRFRRWECLPLGVERTCLVRALESVNDPKQISAGGEAHNRTSPSEALAGGLAQVLALEDPHHIEDTHHIAAARTALPNICNQLNHCAPR